MVATFVVATLGSCSDDGDPPGEPDASTTGDPSGTSAVEIPPDLGRAFERLLDRRADALLTHDRASFRHGLSKADEAFVTEQAAYFANLRQLPLAELGFELDLGSLVRSGDDYWGVVKVTVELAGFDERPAVSLDRYRFSPVGDGGRKFALSSVTDAAWEERNEVFSQPWDRGPVEVRSGDGVLGIFDATSVRVAGPLIDSVERGISDVAGTVPYEWPRAVVVYALSDTGFLGSIEDPPGGHPERLDGVAFPVDANPTGIGVASTRFVLHPRMLDRRRMQRDRLVRHELTHVAIGERDDHAPVWLSEGLAEYVSVRPIPPEDRMISDAALAAARGRMITDLPDDETFNDDDSAVHYGVAWWACEYLAAALGEGSLWSILDELETAGAEGDPDWDARLEEMTGINARTLARKAAKLMLATYEPPDVPDDDPSGQPTDPSVNPSADPSPGTDRPATDRRSPGNRVVP